MAEHTEDRRRRQRRQPRQGPPGGGYDYEEEHDEWAGFEPERRDYGPGYRSAYTYGEQEGRSYEGGYDYEEEHDDWAGNEPERRDYGQPHAPQYRPQNPTWRNRGPHTGKGPKGYSRSDDQIFEDVCERLTQNGQLDASPIEVTVDGGEVTLSGTVDGRRSKRLAEDIADSVSGVRDVHNRLKIPRRSGG